MRRGEVWWAGLAPPTGHRPVVLVSRDDAYGIRDFVMVAPVTSRVRGIPAEVRLGPDDGLSRACAANLDSLQTVPRARLQRRLAMLTTKKLNEIDEALRFALSL